MVDPCITRHRDAQEPRNHPPARFPLNVANEKMRAGPPQSTCNCDGTVQGKQQYISLVRELPMWQLIHMCRDHWPEVFVPMARPSRSMARGICTNGKTGLGENMKISLASEPSGQPPASEYPEGSDLRREMHMTLS